MTALPPPVGGPPLRVGVIPDAAFAARPRLLAALELAFPVRFESRRDDCLGELDAVIEVGSRADGAPVADRGMPAFTALGAESEAGAPVAIELADDPLLPRPLRGVRLHDTSAAGPAIAPGGRVLATGARDAPLWSVRERPGGPHHVVAHAPAELEAGEALRERLSPGRNLAVLALAHFLGTLTADRRWQPLPSRAAFVFDDPNLHWPTYGHIHYETLLAHAREHGHHVSVAMVPLDAWLVHPRAARQFRAGAAQLSLCVHGNDHTGPELWHVRTDSAATAVAAQALRRIARFERRTGIAVSRVMVPPHERVSRASARALAGMGYEAICNTRPYPWARELDQRGPAWLTRPPEAGPLAGWESVDVVGDGLPVLLRAGFEHPREDLALRAFLGQPLILYGHHDDLREGLDVLEHAAAGINALGDVAWGPLHELARGAVETCRQGAVLHARPRARRTNLDVPDGIDELVVDTSALTPGAEGHVRLRRPGDAAVTHVAARGEPIRVGGRGRIELSLPATPPPAPAGSPRRTLLWPVARRVVVESRDRAQAILAR